MAKKIFLDFKPYPRYKNCFVNNEACDWLEKENSTVSHYMPYTRLEEWVEKSVMTFVSPSKWDDPFEKIYLGSTLLNLPLLKKYTSPQIACLCFTKKQFKDSVAFWNSFKTDESTQLVRVQFDLKKLVNQLAKILEKKKLNIYIAAVDYSLLQNSIKNKKKFISCIIEKSQNKEIDAESFYMKMLSCKRKAFAFEEEIRIMLVPQTQIRKNILDKDDCYLVKMDFQPIVQKIWLEPIRLPAGWVSEDFAKERIKKLQDKIQQSQLYEKQQKCSEIDFSKILTTKKSG